MRRLVHAIGRKGNRRDQGNPSFVRRGPPLRPIGLALPTFTAMKAAIKGYSRTDNEDLSSYEPGDQQVFGFTLLFSIGVKGQEGADYFEVEVASPGYLEHLTPQPFFLRHTLVATDYNLPAAVALVTKYVEGLEAETWEQLARQIGRVARWEYEDYRAAQ